MSDLATQLFDTTDLTASLRKLRHTEGRASFANDENSDRPRLQIIHRHLAALSSELKPSGTNERRREPARAQDAGRDAGALVMTRATDDFGQLNYAGTVTLIDAPSTSGMIVSASMMRPGFVSGFVSGSVTFPQGASRIIDNTSVPFSVLNFAGRSSVFHSSGVLWNTPGFAPVAPLQVFSEVGSETNFPTEEEIREMESGDFLDCVYARIAAGHVSAAMDAVIDYLDRLLNDGLFRVCDKLLAQANLERMPSNVRRAFLAVTRPAKQELPARAAFYNEALRLLSQERGEATARKMLKSLA